MRHQSKIHKIFILFFIYFFNFINVFELGVIKKIQLIESYNTNVRLPST